MWTKRELVVQAFEEVGLAAYIFDLDPEQLESAKRRMDTMMATWDAMGIHVGYALASTPTSSDLDDPSGVPDWANEAIYLNLGIRLAPGFGKAVLPETKVAAKIAYDALMTKAVGLPPQMQLRSGVPAGAGNKPWRTTEDPFLPRPNDDPLQVGPGGNLEFIGD